VRANGTRNHGRSGLCADALDIDGLPSEFRWNEAAVEVQGALNDQLGGQRGIFTAVGSQVLTASLRHGLRNRVMPAVSLFLGDVLSWFRNREEILSRVHNAVKAAGEGGPLVLLGHSLGGVIAFEYCTVARDDVDLLATVGSQVGWFGEMGVLRASARPSGGRRPLPPKLLSWQNLYDPDDALSFLAAPVFDGVRDIELDTRAPFPVSHSEYWYLPETYRRLTAAVMTL
jgi:pimeloyl-ACP methyl ester carboxylesterase